MARGQPWWRNVLDRLTGTTRPPIYPIETPSRPPSPEISRNEPPPRRPVNRNVTSSDSYEELERSALARIDSFNLDELPDRVSVDRYGKEHVHEAEYNRERVWERLQELPKIMLADISQMDRDEFRSWCILNGFFYH